MKANKQLVFPWLFTLGLIGAALMLTVVIGFPRSFSTGMPSQYSYNLPAIKSRFLHYLSSYMWSLLVPKEEAPVLTSRNLFLLVNLIIFLILGSMHLQQHAAASAARKVRKMSRISHKEKLELCRIDFPKPLHGSSLSSCIEKEEDIAIAADYMASPDQACKETSLDGISAAAISDLQIDPQAVKEELFLNEEPNTAGSASVEILPAQYPGPPAAVAANDNELPACGALDQDGQPTATVERIILEEDGRLQLMEMQGGWDAPKNEDGRSGCDERPLTTASRRKQVRGQRRPQPQSSDSNSSSTTNSRDTKSEPHVSGNDSRGRANPSSKGHNVPKSISLNSNELLLDDHQKEKSSESNLARSRVKSMDAARKRGKKNVQVKRAFGLRREPSITSQEELNARVESFIAKFNENMKIQRQQSLLSYMQMVDRGAS